jgi:hypothetical protein
MVKPLFRKMPSDWWLRARLHLKKCNGLSAPQVHRRRLHHGQDLRETEMISRS